MSKRRQVNKNHTPKNKAPRVAPSSLLNKLVASTSSGLQMALSRFAMGGGGITASAVPDYHGFKEWLDEQMRFDPSREVIFARQNGLNRGATTPSVRLMLEMRETEQRLASEFQKHRGPFGESHLRKYNQLKLLMSALRSDTRASEVHDAFIHRASWAANLDDGLSTCSQAELRARLFVCIERENWRTAFKVIGRLKEESHDAGELSYLEALARYHSDDLLGCIKYAAQVSPGHIDYPGACALWLEALAYQGSPEALFQRLTEVGTASLSPLFLRYLIQVTVLHSDDPERAASFLNRAELEQGWAPKNLKPANDPFARAFNRQTCALAVRVLEAAAAAELTRALSSEDQDGDGAQEFHIDPKMTRLLLALMCSDHGLAGELTTAKAPHRSRPIVLRLMNGPYEAELADFTQALLAQLRLGEIEPFIDNVTRMVAQLPTGSWPSAIVDILRVAWLEAATRGHPATEGLMKALLQVPESEPDLASKEEIIRKQRLIFLSPMGQLAYIWAEEALRSAEMVDSWHGDAGMISLGFFRILEHELNHLLVDGLQKSENAISELDEIWTRVGENLITVDPALTKKLAKKRADTHALWSQLLPRVQGVIKGERSGLELGTLALLMEKSRSSTGDDVELKQYFAKTLTRRLNDQGRVAYMAGEISRFIEQGVVEKFRNPAAHARFVSLASAQACKRHVDNALTSLSNWTTSSDR